MAVMVVINWPGVSLEQYDEARRKVDWEGNRPDGGQHHAAAHDGSGMRIVDLWESPEKFQSFVESRLMPVVAGEMGVTQEPQVEILPLHAVYAPNEK